MAHISIVEQEHIRAGIVNEISRLTKLLEGFDNSNSQAEEVAKKQFGLAASPSELRDKLDAVEVIGVVS